MPLEGHWARTQTPLGTRQRAGIGVGAAALAAVTAVLVIASPGSAARAPGCVDATIASTTGGAAIHACGDQARALCASAPVAAAVRTACREAGYADAVR
jgi:ABC-type thiamin/hydroxymethylpyrimidine transport system permease subunit